MARKAAPAWWKGHNSESSAILAEIEGTSPESYTGALNMVKLFKDIVDLLSDEAFGTLFISAQSGDSSGSARESTTGRSA